MATTIPEYYVSFSKTVIDDISNRLGSNNKDVNLKKYCLVWQNQGLKSLKYSIGGSRDENKNYGYSLILQPSKLGENVSFEDIFLRSISKAIEDNVDTVLENFDYDENTILELSSGNNVYIYGEVEGPADNGTRKVYKIGPFGCSVAKLNIQAVSDGGLYQEEISVQLVPDQQLPALTNQESLGIIQDLGDQLRIEGYTQTINLSSTSEVTYGKATFDKVKNNSTFGINLTVNTQEDIDYHLLIKDLIKDLLYKATGNRNIIVLLPNINVVCREKIDEFYNGRTTNTQNQPPQNEPGQAQKNTNNPASLYAQSLKLIRLEKLRSFAGQLGLELVAKTAKNQIIRVSTNTRENERYGTSQGAKFEEFFNLNEFRLKLSAGLPKIGVPGGAPLSDIQGVINVIRSLLGKLNILSEGQFQIKNITVENNQSIVNFLNSNEFQGADIKNEYGNPSTSTNRNYIIVGDSNIINYGLYQGLLWLTDDSEKPGFYYHPIDSAVFESTEYSKLFTERVRTKYTDILSPYFFPTFQLGKQTSNFNNGTIAVKSFNIEQNELYRSALNTVVGIAQQTGTSLTSDTQKKLNTAFLDPLSEDEIKQILRTYYIRNNENLDETVEDIRKLFETLIKNNQAKLDDFEDLEALLIRQLLTYTTTNNDAFSKIEVDDKYLFNLNTAKTIMIQNLKDTKLQISLKPVLPCHHLGTFNLLAKPCTFIPNPSAFSSYFSKSLIPSLDFNYKIIGYTHELKVNDNGSVDAGSEFHLLKNIP